MAETSPLVANARVYTVLETAPSVRTYNVRDGQQGWTQSAGSRAYGQAVADETLYVTGRGLYAYDVTDGERAWSFSVPDSPGGSPTIFAAPAVVDGTVYVSGGADTPILYALDETTGDIQWRTQLAGSLLHCTPAVSDDSVYVVDSDFRLAALDRTDGAIRWVRDDLGDLYSTPVFADGAVYVAERYDPGVYSLTTAGEVRWQAEVERRGASAIAVDGERVYVPRDGGLRALSATTGELEWTFDTATNPEMGSPVVAGETVYVGSDVFEADDDTGGQAGGIFAIHAPTGERQWAFRTRVFPVGEGLPRGGTLGEVAVTGEVLFACTGAGDVYAISSG